MMRRSLVTALALLPLGCTTEEVFVCASDESCIDGGEGGRCEPTGWCSFLDESCDSGRRYGMLAGQRLSGACVGTEGETDTAAGTTSGSTTTSGGGVTSADATTTGDSSDATSDATLTTGDDTTGSVPEGGVPFGPWWDCAYGSRVPIDVTGLEDLGGAFSDVVVLVALDSSRIDYAATAAGGVDVRFVTADHETELPREIEVWNPLGVSFLWVRLPAVEQGEPYFMYYEGPGSSPPFDATDVWPDHYRAVWHMNASGDDATQHASHGDTEVEVGAGHIGSGAVASGSGSIFSVSGSGALANVFADGGTVSGWVRAAGTPAFGSTLLRKSAGEDGRDGWTFEMHGGGGEIRFGRGFTMGRQWFDGGGLPPSATWTHVAVLYDDSAGVGANARLVVDGVEVGFSGGSTGVLSPPPVSDASSTLHVGAELVGLVDEVRMRTGGTVDEAIVDHRAQADQLLSFGPLDRSGCFVEIP
jgi:hypothetical protein